MSDLETAPDLLTCNPEAPHAEVEVLSPREVPLGGLRAMPVRRTLPQRQRSLIGAWCFLDHYGPDDVDVTGGMVVAPHPHTGLQTVSWLFEGEIEHRDSTGAHAMVRPGEVNLMTAGQGIAHSEVSTTGTTTLHGAQLWVALPDSARHTDPGFQHYAPTPFDVDGARITVFLGSLAGDTSPVLTFTPLLGAEITIDPGTTLPLDVDATFEHGVLVDDGAVTLHGTRLDRAELGYLTPGHAVLRLVNHTAQPARILLLGGPPFGEAILMWWNFVGRSNDEIIRFREQWQHEIATLYKGAADVAPQFGLVPGYVGGPIPAPTLPSVPIKPRR
ncbi:MAG TPA: pirin family protein [Aldersonia sp.]